jgi:hypothetical protein
VGEESFSNFQKFTAFLSGFSCIFFKFLSSIFKAILKLPTVKFKPGKTGQIQDSTLDQAIKLSIAICEYSANMVHLIIENLLSTATSRVLYQTLWSLSMTKNCKPENLKNCENLSVESIW